MKRAYESDGNRPALPVGSKVLKDANFVSVADDTLGKSGRAMLVPLFADQNHPERLADLSLGTQRQDLQLKPALELWPANITDSY